MNNFIAKVQEGAALTREKGVDESVDLGTVAAPCNIVPGSYKKMSHEEITQIFQEAL